MRNFVRQLERLKEVVGRNPGLREVAIKLSNPAGFLDNMMKVAEQVKLKLRQLKQTSETFQSLLQLDSRPLGENILQLVETTKTDIMNPLSPDGAAADLLFSPD